MATGNPLHMPGTPNWATANIFGRRLSTPVGQVDLSVRRGGVLIAHAGMQRDNV